MIFDLGRGIAGAVGHDFDVQFAGDVLAGGERRLLAGGDVGGDDAQAVKADRATQRIDRVEAAAARLQRGDGGSELKRFGRGQVGDRSAEQDAREELVLRHRRRAGEGDFRAEAGALHRDGGAKSLDVRLGVNVELRIGRAFAAEADDAAVEPEVAAGEIVIALDEVGAAGEARLVGEAADLEVGGPAAVDAEARDLKIAGSDLSVTGLGISSRWTTNLQIGGFADAPRFTGRADLVQGNYDFAGRIFRLDRGIIRFRGESPPDPLLDIHAVADVQSLNASVTVNGTGLKPEITFASNPPMPQDELLSRILFGTSITNLSAPEALQLASAVAALRSGSGSLDPINALRRAVGLDRLRIVPADVATGQKTAIAAGKYIRHKLFVEVVTDGQGYSATNVEYQMTRWLSILSTVSTIGRASASVRVSKDY